MLMFEKTENWTKRNQEMDFLKIDMKLYFAATDWFVNKRTNFDAWFEQLNLPTWNRLIVAKAEDSNGSHF